MALTDAEKKARRRAGMDAMTAAEKIRRGLTGGRPPASELKTPLAAVTAAKALHRELETRMTAEGMEPKPGDWAVFIGYVSVDLSVLGFTRPFAPGADAGLMDELTGHIPLGLVFGMVDKDAKDERRIVVGARPFLETDQTEAWLSELLVTVRLEMELP